MLAFYITIYVSCGIFHDVAVNSFLHRCSSGGLNSAGTGRRNDVELTSLRHNEVIST